MGRMTTKEFRKLYITYKCKSHTIVMSYFEKKYNDIDKIVEDNIDTMLLDIEKEYRRFFIKRIICFQKFIFDRNISIKEIAKICGVTTRTARNWVKGKNWPLQKNILKIGIKTGFDYNMR